MHFCSFSKVSGSAEVVCFVLWYKKLFSNATIFLFLYIFHCCSGSYTSIKQVIYVTDMLGM